VVGPPVPMYAFGARILDILPIIQLVGNVGLTLCAFSYAGRVSLVVTADATAFPDLDVLMAGMEQDWDALHGRRVEQPVDVRPPAGHRIPASRPVLATHSAGPTQMGEHQ
jgi:diacylglycerol O-acyltransferase / wax synthase